MNLSAIQRELCIVGVIFAAIIFAEANPIQAQYSRLSGFGGRYGGFGSYSYGIGQSYFPSFQYGSGFRGYGNSYRNSPYSYGSRFDSAYQSRYQSPVNRGLYSRSSQSTPAPKIAPFQFVTTYNDGLDYGWQLLAAGNDAEALQYFGRIANNNTYAAEPKVGYAMAATACGDITTGAWAMRRALNLNANAIDQLQQDPLFRNSRSQLMTKFAKMTSPNADVDYLMTNLKDATSQKSALVVQNPEMEMMQKTGSPSSIVNETKPPPPAIIPSDEATEATPPVPTEI